jgi:H+/Cl- antiporter ClcA
MANAATTTADPMRRKSYVVLLFITAGVGLLVSALAYYFLVLITDIQTWVFTDIPGYFTSHTMMTWWPLIPLIVAGLVVGLTIRYLPGTGGEVPIEGFNVNAGTPAPKLLPGIFIAAVASISLGVVVGPEAPLIALGGGVALLAVRLVKQDIPSRAGAIIAAAGSFAAVSALFGNPLIGAFLMLEVCGLSGPTLD